MYKQSADKCSTLSDNVDNIKTASNVALLIVSVGLIPAFVFWVSRQEKRGRPALIPNSIWKKGAFATICVLVLLSNAVANCMELFCSLLLVDRHTLYACWLTAYTASRKCKDCRRFKHRSESFQAWSSVLPSTS